MDQYDYEEAVQEWVYSVFCSSCSFSSYFEAQVPRSAHKEQGFTPPQKMQYLRNHLGSEVGTLSKQQLCWDFDFGFISHLNAEN